MKLSYGSERISPSKHQEGQLSTTFQSGNQPPPLPASLPPPIPPHLPPGLTGLISPTLLSPVPMSPVGDGPDIGGLKLAHDEKQGANFLQGAEAEACPKDPGLNIEEFSHDEV